MTTEIIKQHKDMVLRLAKPGEAILKSLTAWDCDFAHMGGCLGGEASELFDAILEYMDTDKTETGNLLEELGDYAFYLVKCGSFFNRDWHGRVFSGSSPTNNCVELMRLGGHFWDVVKRRVIYRKPMDLPDPKYNERLLSAVAVDYLNKMEERFNSIMTFYNFTLHEVLQANYDKLADADKGRYASGSYSDEQAQARRDKQ